MGSVKDVWGVISGIVEDAEGVDGRETDAVSGF